MTTPVEVRRLGPTHELAKGRVGEILDAPGYHLAGVGPMVFKRFFTSPDAVSVDNLRRLIDFRTALPAVERSAFDELFVWPLQLVVDGPDPVGYMMRKLDATWMQMLSLTRRELAVRETKWLLADTASAARSSVPVPAAGADVDRLVICAKLSRALMILHRHGLVYGDLHQSNAIFRLEPVPMVALVDCDSVKIAAGFRQPNHDLWKAPEATGREQTESSDRYKIALFILRSIADGERSSSTRDPDRASAKLLPASARALDDVGLAMLRRGLGRDPADRPSAAEWYHHLRALLVELTSPPMVTRVEVSETIVLTGSRVVVSWDVGAGADSLHVLTSDGLRIEQDASQRTGTAEVTVVRAGALEVVATNDFGHHKQKSPPITVFEPARLEVVRIPEPRVPTAFGADRELINELRFALARHAPEFGGVLPPLPDVLVGGVDAAVPAAARAAADTDALRAFDGLSQLFDALTAPLRDLSMAMATPDTITLDVPHLPEPDLRGTP